MKLQCPICKKPTDSECDSEYPFCSQRCRTLDLGNWASERYVVSEPVMDEDAGEEPPTHNPSDADHDDSRN